MNDQASDRSACESRRVKKLYTRIKEQAKELYNCLIGVVHLLNALDAKFEGIKNFSTIKQPYTAKILEELKAVVNNPESYGDGTSPAITKRAEKYVASIQDEVIKPETIEKEV